MIDYKKEAEPTVEDDIEEDPELKQKLLQAKEDKEDGNYYTSAEMREMLRSGRMGREEGLNEIS
ncbi:hypothetical protein [Lentibacillus sediminis]|uniref:hypothetical protein n=1 Tax=Lentibacillus sediminis TaxID=1940529 RepID=UPI000C1C7C33|nr:hypothetical protein [Lentibacillus sediminis]